MATVAAAITMMSVSIVPSCIPRRAFDQPGGDRNRQDRPALRIYAGREMNATSLALFLGRRTASLAALLILPHHCGKTGSRGPKMSLARVRHDLGSDRERGGPPLPGAALRARQTGIISGILLVPHVAAEIVIGGNVGGIALDAVRAVMAGRQDRLQERALMGPGRLRLGAAVAPRHGVIEPAVRRVAIDLDVVTLSVAIQTVAQAPDVVERDQMIGFAEHSEHGTIDRGDDLVERARIL